MNDGKLPPRLRKGKYHRVEASEYLLLVHGLSYRPGTLAKMACNGTGPRFHRAVRTPLYPRTELDRWAEERLGRLMRSTRETM